MLGGLDKRQGRGFETSPKVQRRGHVATTPKSRVLLLTTSSDLSADLVITTLRKLRARVLRWNLEDFPLSSTASWNPDGKLRLIAQGQEFTIEEFKSAWYRRTAAPRLPDELQRSGAESFVTGEIDAFLRGLCETSRWFWVNPPNRVEIAENKLRQLASATALGFAVPATLVTNDCKEARRFLRRFPLAVAKSIARSAIELDGSHWAVFTRPLSRADVIGERALRISPCIFQEMIPKRADVRVTVVGSKIFAAAIMCKDPHPPEVDWRALENRSLIYRRHVLPRAIADRCHLLMQELGLVYGCFDFVLTPEGRYFFLEINPSGQWGWIEHELGFRITDEIARLLINGKN